MRFPEAPSLSQAGREQSTVLRSYAFDRLSAIAAILDDTGTILDTNEAWRLFSRLNDGQLGVTGSGSNYVEVCERSAANGSQDAASVAIGLRSILSGERARFDLEYPCDSPTESRWFLLSAAAAPAVNGSGVVLFHVDITARKAVEERLALRSDVDELTGLPNRRAAVRMLEAELDAVRLTDAPVTVMFLDLDGFKTVNDEHGHAMGDRLLVQVASRIGHAVREGDVLCRFGGDEFVLICPSLHSADAQVLATRIREVTSAPFQLDATELCTGVSVGLATSDSDSTLDVLLEAADVAMYIDKRRPRPERNRRVRSPRAGHSMPAPLTSNAEAPPDDEARLIAELHANRAMTDAILAHSVDLVMLFQADGAIEWASPAAASMFGVDPEDLLGHNRLSLVHPDDQHRVSAIFPSIPAMGDHVCTEFRVTRPNGSMVWIEETATNLLDQSDVGMIVGNLRDITDRRTAEEVARFRSTLLAAAGQAIIAIDMSGVVIYWNRAAEEMYGWLASEAVGAPILSIFPVGDGWGPTEGEIRENVRIGEPWSGEFVLRTKDGSELAVTVTDTPVFDDSGVQVATIGISSDITERRRNAETAARLSAIVEGSQDAIFSHDLDGAIETWNGAAVRLFGYSEADVAGLNLSDLVAPGSADDLVKMLRRVADGDESTSIQTIGQRADGSNLHIVVLISPVRNSAGEVVGASAIARDISEGVELRERTESDRRRLSDAQASARLGSFELDTVTGVMTRSDEMWRILGMDPGTIAGVDFDYIHPDDRDAVERAFTVAMSDGTDAEMTHRIVRPDGSVRWVISRAGQLEGSSADVLAGTMLDITERHEAEMALAYQATHDTLTGLPNRSCLDAKLCSSFSVRPLGGPRVAVAIVDLDQFKSLNDTFGHQFGDDVLRATAERLRAEFPLDGLYRFGGDEFVVVRDGIDSDVEAGEFGAEIDAALAAPIGAGARLLEITASIGVARSMPEDTPESLLRDADTAMYQAKADGRARVVAFDARGRERAHRRSFLESALRLALERDQLHLVFQPVIDLTSLQVAGFESLLRWEHPDLGSVAPDEFIPIAEDTGLIFSIGDWVLQRSLEQLASWIAHPAVEPGLWMAVNLSAQQLGKPDLVQRVADAMERTAVPPESVHLEITETIFVDRVANAVATITGLHELGARITMDDFGTGYSSLSYLNRLPINTLKIDRCFVQATSSGSDTSILNAIAALAESLDLDVVAEGIETEEQLEIIHGLGCGFGQGFLWSRPVPAAEALTWALTTKSKSIQGGTHVFGVCDRSL